MSRYVKKADRSVMAALGTLQGVIDSPDSSHAQRQEAATAILDYHRSHNKAEPLREKLAETIKARRAAERERDSLTGELTEARERLTALEAVEQEFAQANEQNGRLATALNAAKATAATAEQRAISATGTAETYKRTVNAIVETLFPKQSDKRLSVGARLFFKHRGSIAADVYATLGINLKEWQQLDAQRFQDQESTLFALELGRLEQTATRFAIAKLQWVFGVDVKEELERRKAERKAAADVEEQARIARADERQTVKVTQRQSDARDQQIREAENPRAPSNVIETIWWR